MADTALMKRLSGLPPRDFQQGFQWLLRNLWITAVQNGTARNESWSTFLYGTAADWERDAPQAAPVDAPRKRLEEILSRTMTARQIQSLLWYP